MEKRYPFFAGIVLSLFLPAFYDDVAHRWKGAAIGYPMLMLLIVWAVTGVFFYSSIDELDGPELRSVTDQLPPLTYDNGKVSTPEDRPYKIELEGAPLILIDTTNQVVDEHDSYPIVLTDTEFTAENNNGRRETHQIAEFDPFLTNGTMDPGDWPAVVLQWVTTSFYIISPFYFIYMLVRALVEALFFSLIALLMNSILSKGLNYAALFRLSVVALTPGYLLSTVLWVCNVYFPFWFLWMLVFYGITVVYVIIGVSSASKTEYAAYPPPDGPGQPAY